MNLRLLRKSLRTPHAQIVLCGLLVGLWYLPNWLGILLNYIFQGVAFPLIVFAASYFAVQELWCDRHKLTKLTATLKQQRLGHILILSGVVSSPFCGFAFWPQALLWLLILVGIALSSWGLGFFKKYPHPIFLILLSVHPTPDILIGQLWIALTPNYLLERLMAWSSSLALQAIGQPATSNDIYIFLPTGGVEIGWGCNGFDMALTIATFGLLVGLIFKQNWLQTLGLAIFGIALALIFNVPRIVLLTFAAVFWGEESFNFWHGTWGGQIFSTIIFTAYYYFIMSIYSQPFPRLQK